MSPILGIWASQNYTRNSYESIATVTVGSGGSANIDFTSIPSTYKHLQIRAIYCNSVASNIRIRFNSDTGSNYNYHILYGNGTSALAGAASTDTTFGYINYQASTTVFSAGVIDILDYTNTNKNTTVRSLTGIDTNGSGTVMLSSSLWLNTAAITSIRLLPESGGNISQYSHFALYGIKG